VPIVHSTALFASDIHLGADEPATAEWFLSDLTALARWPQLPEAFFVLGDLFEAWIGDDLPVDPAERSADDELALRTAAALAAVAVRSKVYLMRGNRDFLMDVALPEGLSTVTPFSARCGAQMIEDETIAVIGGHSTLLAHGDAMCTDDAAYQAMRTTVRDPTWQRDILGQPRAQRLELARQLRNQSKSATREKPSEIVDVSANTVADRLRRHRVARLIHGHTHRPASHQLVVDGERAQRTVIPDWDAKLARAGYVMVVGGGMERIATLTQPPSAGRS
jgi:UDP-2,3-diacylglucosamine hydrolase